jgi:hypothetical protein
MDLVQRPFGMAAAWQGLPVRLERAPHQNPRQISQTAMLD